MDPEHILRTSVGLGFLTADEADACRRTMAGSESAADALGRVGRLTRDQIRAVMLIARQEEARREDTDLGEFIIRNGFLDRTVVDECLRAQASAYDQGEDIARLTDMLLERGALSRDQAQGILRARAQMDAMRLQLKSPSKPAPAPAPEPEPQPPPPVEPLQPVIVAIPEAPRPPAASSGTRMRTRVGVAGAEGTGDTRGLVMTARPMHLRHPTRGDLTVHVLEVSGSVGAEAAGHLRSRIDALFNEGATHIVVNVERLAVLVVEGVQVLTAALAKSRELGGEVRLCNVSAPVKTALDGVPGAGGIRTYDSERGAILSFKYM